MRGEHRSCLTITRAREGSSPHARGAPEHEGLERPDVGIIPACAGSTVPCSGPVCATRDHPRMRGEHSNAALERSTDVGSSPHARGARLDLIDLGLGSGIIPACAGSTQRRTRCRTASWDHPRMRGEHYRPGYTGIVEMGSSPHARGAL